MLMERLIQDLRFAFRTLRRQPSVTTTIVITLAFGIGAASSIFSVVNAVLIRPLPYSDPSRLVIIDGNFLKLDMKQLGASPPEFVEYRDQTKSFEEIAAFNNVRQNLGGSEKPRRVTAAQITGGLFRLLRAEPAFGRLFDRSAELEAARNSVVLSAGLAAQRFGSMSSAVGQQVLLDGVTHTVVGVMPEGFEFPHPDLQFAERADLFLPLPLAPEMLEQRSRYNLRVIARLSPGVSLDQARSEMDALAGSFIQQYPRSYLGPGGEDGGWRITVVPLSDQITGSVKPALLILMGAVVLLLLIACANTANIMLARVAGRTRELAIRMALGASRGAIIRQLLAESIVLAILGGGLGLLLTLWFKDLILAINPDRIPRLAEVDVDWRVISFTAAVSVLTALVFGTAPALQASTTKIKRWLRDGGDLFGSAKRRQTRLRSLLVVAEISISLVLLVSAGLLVRSMIRLSHVDPGFNPRNVLTMEIDLPAAKYSSEQQRRAFFQEVLDRVTSLSGVKSAGVVSILPMSGSRFDGPFSIEGRPFDPTKLSSADYRIVSAGLFDALGVRLRQGNALDRYSADPANPGVIINQTLANDFFSGDGAIGKRIKLGAPRSPRPWMTIIGVCEDVRERSLSTAPRPAMYVSSSQESTASMALVVRTEQDPSSLSSAVQASIVAVDRDQPISNVRTLGQVVAAASSRARFNSILLSGFAGVALLLAAIGIFGVVSYTVSQRTREIGIRMALGADRGDVLKIVVRQGVTLTLIGLAIGLAGTLATGRLLSSLLFETEPNDPLTMISISLLLAAVAITASVIPARRAIKVDPLIALRCE